MSFCRNATLVKFTPQKSYARRLYCRSWNCPTCQPSRRKQLLALCASGEPTRFLTLTVNPEIGDSPARRLTLLAWAWRNCVKRLRRSMPSRDIQYLAVVEETKKGEPHLHILLRSPYIPQHLISSIMSDLIDSPIVDIRRIYNARSAINYLAKYISKAPAQFGTAKRYWRSQHYEIPGDDSGHEPIEPDYPWTIAYATLERIIEEFIDRRYSVEHETADIIIAIPFGNADSG